jgi:hypothetical protein
MKGYILSTIPDDMPEFDKVYLQAKQYHLSYITPLISDAIIFETKKQAIKFMADHKMLESYWNIEKIKK